VSFQNEKKFFFLRKCNMTTQVETNTQIPIETQILIDPVQGDKMLASLEKSDEETPSDGVKLQDFAQEMGEQARKLEEKMQAREKKHQEEVKTFQDTLSSGLSHDRQTELRYLQAMSEALKATAILGEQYGDLKALIMELALETPRDEKVVNKFLKDCQEVFRKEKTRKLN